MHRNKATDRLSATDELVLEDLIRFGALTLVQIARRYGLPRFAPLPRLDQLKEDGFVEVKNMFATNLAYVLPTRRAIRAVRSAFRALDGGPQHLEHHLSVASLADWLVDQNPGAEWLTERQLRKEYNASKRFSRWEPDGHPPDGALIVNDRRIGIELEKRFVSDAKYAHACRWYAAHIGFHEVRWYVLAERLLQEIPRIVRYHGLDADIQIVTQLIPLEVELVGWTRR